MRAVVLNTERDKRVLREVRFSSVNSCRNDTQELSLRVNLHRQTLVWGENSDAVNVASLHHRRCLVWVIVRSVSDVSVKRSVAMLGIPQGAGVVDVVREQNLNSRFESHEITTPPSSTVTPFRLSSPSALSAWTLSCLCVKGSTVLSPVASVRLSSNRGRLVNREKSNIASTKEKRCDDIPIVCEGRRNGIGIALDIWHHEAAKTREIRKVNMRDNHVTVPRILDVARVDQRVTTDGPLAFYHKLFMDPSGKSR